MKTFSRIDIHISFIAFQPSYLVCYKIFMSSARTYQIFYLINRKEVKTHRHISSYQLDYTYITYCSIIQTVPKAFSYVRPLYISSIQMNCLRHKSLFFDVLQNIAFSRFLFFKNSFHKNVNRNNKKFFDNITM